MILSILLTFSKRIFEVSVARPLILLCGLSACFGTPGIAAYKEAVTGLPTRKLSVQEAVSETNKLLGKRKISDILGVTHTNGQYALTEKPFLIEGSEAVNKLGAKIIKLWFSPGYKKSYSWHSQWPEDISSLEELAKSPYFESVFAMPFHTYVLEVYEFIPQVYFWKKGLYDKDKAMVHNDILKLSTYLLTRYRGSGKTFILQNWESDNAMKQAMKGTMPEEWDIAYQGMREWINTRQSAVEEAREKCGTDGVRLFNAMEVNFIPSAKMIASGKTYKSPIPPAKVPFPLIVDAVVPQTHCDLYSFSSWETCYPGTEDTVFDRLQYLAAKAPHDGILGSANLMLGEFGAHEDNFEKAGKTYPIYQGDTSGSAFYALQLMVKAALRAGVRYIIHWQIYSNDLRMGGKDQGLGLPPGVMATKEDCVGNWLIRPDGTRVPTYDYFKGLFDLENDQELSRLGSDCH